jgi:hypothetical protein
MRNSWGGARLNLPADATSAEQITIDLPASRVFARDSSGVPLFGGLAAPGIESFKAQRDDAVVIQPPAASMGDLPEFFSGLGAFSANEQSKVR